MVFEIDWNLLLPWNAGMMSSMSTSHYGHGWLLGCYGIRFAMFLETSIILIKNSIQQWKTTAFNSDIRVWSHLSSIWLNALWDLLVGFLSSKFYNHVFFFLSAGSCCFHFPLCKTCNMPCEDFRSSSCRLMRQQRRPPLREGGETPQFGWPLFWLLTLW